MCKADLGQLWLQLSAYFDKLPHILNCWDQEENIYITKFSYILWKQCFFQRIHMLVKILEEITKEIVLIANKIRIKHRHNPKNNPHNCSYLNSYVICKK